ncbi:MAG TPA: hypothetical protein VE545_05350 [Candidatus Dormibacteraeota bacterium]|nr:hypothetical protein [Candidatus Dormibacteraeota bacterium]
MSTEPQSSTSLKFTADPRLAAAAAGVARYLAEAAGLESDAITKLQAATLATCVAGAPTLAEGEAQVSADVSRYADRIEVLVTHPGITGKQSDALPGVDRVQREIQNNRSVTRLTKFITQS